MFIVKQRKIVVKTLIDFKTDIPYFILGNIEAFGIPSPNANEAFVPKINLP